MWISCKEKYPSKPGFYFIKIIYGRELDKKLEWNGEDWVLPIGRIVSDEVEYWKEEEGD